MTPLEQAIGAMAELVESFRQGTPQAPREGTASWFLLRAHALGLSQLRRMAQLQLDGDHAAAERFYRQASSTFKRLDVPDPVEVAREAGGGVVNG